MSRRYYFFPQTHTHTLSLPPASLALPPQDFSRLPAMPRNTVRQHPLAVSTIRSHFVPSLSALDNQPPHQVAFACLTAILFLGARPA
ncbi:hypothetical protein K431DRAFT_281474 [Polychaeton citri CBS 116435]|uniref:Uncharacterized protein n=1 Tax=Polychaeton citri CBS 116435 TaxID=1314669 RepID=A0A9P4QD10_9PEZI|nr:hypothetical protein K431DRAFT_281474 [Polychaeton citri CBS 116435]